MPTVTARPASYSAYNSASISNASMGTAACVANIGLAGPLLFIPQTSGISLEGFNFSAIPDSAIINSITIHATLRSSDTTYVSSCDVLLSEGGTSYDSNTFSGLGTSDTSHSVKTTYKTGTTKWLGADLKDSTFLARLTATPLISGVYLYLSDFYLVVDYTEAVTGVFRPTAYKTPYSGLGFSVSGWAHDTSTTATMTMSGSRNSVFDILYTFDLASIPDGSTINSIEVTWTGKTNNAARFYGTYLALTSGGSEISSVSVDESNNSRTATISGATVSLEQLKAADFGLRFYTTHDSSYDGIYYLEDLYVTINYTAPGSTTGTGLYFKAAGTWSEVSAIYKKVSGAWVEQSDIAGILDTSANYKHITS